MMRVRRHLAAAGMLALVMSCAAKRTEHASAPRAPLPGSDGHAEIEARWQEIQRARVEVGLTDEPTAITMAATGPLTVDDAARVCEAAPPPPLGVCHEVCELAGSICDNARAICQLADELPGDAWAADRCGSAKASCREAEQRCCDCRPKGMP
jgi:hypothetical protein